MFIFLSQRIEVSPDSGSSASPARKAKWFLWSVLGLTVLAAAIRFPTLGLQSYRHDEAVTAGRVLGGSLGAAMHSVWSGESTPPLYYLLAWFWSQLFGVGEFGLRSLSALFGTATVPFACLAGRELVGRRTGIALGALVAVNPLLIWYSQDARAYALLVLLTTAAFWFFLRARRGGEARDLAGWAVCSALALASHYFAFFPLAIEAVWLLVSVRPRRRAGWAVGGVAAAGLALAPIALHQAGGKNNSWIAGFHLSKRLHDAVLAFFAGETGALKHALVPALLLAAAVALLLWRGGPRERRAAGLALAIGGGAIAVALLFAAAGKDYILARNLIVALVPLLAVAAVGLGMPRAGRLGIALGAALAAYWLAFAVYVDVSPVLQREDWRSVAAAIGPPSARPRAIVAFEQGDEPLSFYLAGTQVRAEWKRWRLGAVPVAEVDVVSGRPPPRHHRALPPAFRQVEVRTLGRMTLVRYRAPRPVALRWPQLDHNFTGYSNNAVLLDGGGAVRQLESISLRQARRALSRSRGGAGR
ncbi:MAG: glycosyltransferase family 39 protein [Actinobacteria bacterium]|nr:glycosyltransferase family 39 protein [Actinomycetota bacterium]